MSNAEKMFDVWMSHRLRAPRAPRVIDEHVVRAMAENIQPECKYAQTAATISPKAPR